MKDEFELEIDDLLASKPGKKKVNGKKKGNRVELNLSQKLTEFFKADFTRSVGSGNRWSQVTLTDAAKQVLSGDISVPEGFLWVIESKGGYEDKLNLNNVCDGGGIPCLDNFCKQSINDSKQCGRKPIVCWKRSRKPWLAAVRKKDLYPVSPDLFTYHINYDNWIIISLDELLDKTPRDFWFSS